MARGEAPVLKENPIKSFASRHTLGVALAASLVGSSALAADGFKLRFPLAGTLAGEMLAPAEMPGWFGNATLTQFNSGKLTDDTGEARRQPVAGVFVTPGPVAGSVRTAPYNGVVAVDSRQKQTQANLVLGLRTEQTYAGGRWSFAANLPYTIKLDHKLALSGSTPSLGPLQPALATPPLPQGAAAQAQATAQAGFGNAYQASLGARSVAGTDEMDGLGDLEVGAAWGRQTDGLKVAAGAWLSIPTGKYDPAASANVGFGKYFTLRPSVLVAYSPNEMLTLGARVSLGLNSRNRDNDIRSGNFAALDAAVMVRTPVGAIGAQVVRVQQYQDDSGGLFGGNRFRSTGAGVFYAIPIRVLDAALTVQYMKMIATRNAQAGDFYQVRLSKQFQ